MSVHTRSQKYAQVAYPKVAGRHEKKDGFDEYSTFARKFPALIHTCGLAQAIAFAQAKGKADDPEGRYLADLAEVLKAGGHTEITSASTLAEQSRTADVTAYLRLSRNAIEAAVWLKRYTEAIAADTPSPPTPGAKPHA